MEKIELIIVVINDNEHIGRIDIAADASVYGACGRINSVHETAMSSH